MKGEWHEVEWGECDVCHNAEPTLGGSAVFQDEIPVMNDDDGWICQSCHEAKVTSAA
jgi:hypothetical protein